MNNKKLIPKEDLEHLYVVQKKSTIEIGHLFGCSAITILNRLREFGIATRGYSEALTGRKNTWAHKAANKLKGRKRPGVGGRQRGDIGWSAGLSKLTDVRLSKTGKQKEQHWNWKGGISGANVLIRQSSEYKVWRKKVFERDAWTCQHCGATKVWIHAHHIKDFSTHEDLRFEISNGITLCRRCHYKVHGKQVKEK